MNFKTSDQNVTTAEKEISSIMTPVRNGLLKIGDFFGQILYGDSILKETPCKKWLCKK